MSPILWRIAVSQGKPCRLSYSTSPNSIRSKRRRRSNGDEEEEESSLSCRVASMGTASISSAVTLMFLWYYYTYCNSIIKTIENIKMNRHTSSSFQPGSHKLQQHVHTYFPTKEGLTLAHHFSPYFCLAALWEVALHCAVELPHHQWLVFVLVYLLRSLRICDEFLETVNLLSNACLKVCLLLL